MLTSILLAVLAATIYLEQIGPGERRGRIWDVYIWSKGLLVPSECKHSRDVIYPVRKNIQILRIKKQTQNMSLSFLQVKW